MVDETHGNINTVEHHIELQPGTKPICKQLLRVVPKKRAVAQAEIHLTLRIGVFEQTQQQWASSGVFAPKNDETLWFCNPYDRLSAVSVIDTCPIHKMYECINSLGSAKDFTSLDCNCGYCQTPLA